MIEVDELEAVVGGVTGRVLKSGLMFKDLRKMRNCY